MFTDETKIEHRSYTNGFIRLSKKTKNKLKNGDEDANHLINRPQKHIQEIFDDYRMYFLLWFIKINNSGRTFNEFSYGQGLLFYKVDINSLMNKNKAEMYFEQDEASAYRCKSNKYLLNKLYPNGHLI